MSLVSISLSLVSTSAMWLWSHERHGARWWNITVEEEFVMGNHLSLKRKRNRTQWRRLYVKAQEPTRGENSYQYEGAFTWWIPPFDPWHWKVYHFTFIRSVGKTRKSSITSTLYSNVTLILPHHDSRLSLFNLNSSPAVPVSPILQSKIAVKVSHVSVWMFQNSIPQHKVQIYSYS